MPDLGADRSGGALVVPGQQHRHEAERAEVGDRPRGRRLDAIGEDEDARDDAVDRRDDRGVAVRLRRCDRGTELGGELVPGRPSDDHRVALDDRLDAVARRDS